LSHVKYLAVVLLLLLPQDEKEAEEDLAEMEAMLYCKLHYLEYQVTEGIFSYCVSSSMMQIFAMLLYYITLQ
jgi:hypothetical protein